MRNVVFNMCEKFLNDRLRKDRSLGNRNSDDNNPKNKHKNNNNVGSAWRPVSGSKTINSIHKPLLIVALAYHFQSLFDNE